MKCSEELSLHLWCGFSSAEQLVASVGVTSTAWHPWAPASLGSGSSIPGLHHAAAASAEVQRAEGMCWEIPSSLLPGSLGTAPHWQR